MKQVSLIKTLINSQPLTSRGVFALLLSGLCIFYFGKQESDLIALVLGFSILLTLGLCLIIIALSYRQIFRHARQTQDQAGGLNLRIHSKNVTFAPLYVSALKIPPFFNLKIKREFETSKLLKSCFPESKNIRLKGFFLKNANNSLLTDYINFKVRGEYNQVGIKVTYGDVLGLTSISKLIKSPNTFFVYPPSVKIEPLPILAASAQLGDIEHSTLERSGDLFDIREYQPGDSLKRVLWKVYARTNKVVVRQPEAAIVPEGEVAIFVLAKLEEDHVASSALNYLDLLNKQNIIYSYSSLGNTEQIAHTLEEAEEVTIKSAHLTMKDEGQSFKKFLGALKTKNFSAHKIIVFASEETLNESTNINSSLNKLKTHASDANLSLYLALVKKPKESWSLKSLSQPKGNESRSLLEKIDLTTESAFKSVKNLKLLSKGKRRGVPSPIPTPQNYSSDFEVINVNYAEY